MSMRYSKVMLELLLAIYHYYRGVCVCVSEEGVHSETKVPTKVVDSEELANLPERLVKAMTAQLILSGF